MFFNDPKKKHDIFSLDRWNVRSFVTRHTRMASSSPPPLVPIHGPDCTRLTIVKQSVGNQEMESQFGTSFNRGHYGVKEEITVKDAYNQQYNKDSFLRNEDLTTQSHMKIEWLELRTLTRLNQEEAGVPRSEFTTDSLCDHFNPSQVFIFRIMLGFVFNQHINTRHLMDNIYIVRVTIFRKKEL